MKIPWSGKGLNKSRGAKVEDAVDAANYGIDIDDQSTFTNNYAYDAIGNLIKDDAEEIKDIIWTVYGKVSEVRRYSGSSKPDLKFYYDAAGRRIMKRIIPNNGAAEKTEFYAHDAQGNTLTIYSYIASDTATYTVSEQMIYGSSRLGTWKSGLDLLAYIPGEPEILVTDRGSKQYEMNDHLGNVHAVVSDRKKRICEEGEFAYYEADIRSTYDYYAFGMMMPGRGFDGYVPPILIGCDTLFILQEDFNDGGFGGFIYPGGMANLDSTLSFPSTYTPWDAMAARNFHLDSTGTYTVQFKLPDDCGPTKSSFYTLDASIRTGAWAGAASGTLIESESFQMESGIYTMTFTVTDTGTYCLRLTAPVVASTCYKLDDVSIFKLSCPYGTDTLNAYSYRFGFNGQMKDDEVYGEGNSYTAEYWQYDPRLGRRWNVDPVVKPWESPYLCFFGNPIVVSDKNGDDGIVTVDKANKTVTVTTKIYYQKSDADKISSIEHYMKNTCGAMEGEYWVDMNEPVNGTVDGNQPQDVWKVVYKTEFIELDIEPKNYDSKIKQLQKLEPSANFIKFDKSNDLTYYQDQGNMFQIGMKSFNPKKASSLYESIGKKFTHEKGHSLGLLHASDYEGSKHYKSEDNGGNSPHGEQQSYADNTYLYPYEVQLSVTSAIRLAMQSNKQIIKFHQQGSDTKGSLNELY